MQKKKAHLTLGSTLGVQSYLCVLLLIFAASFLDSPLSWHNYIVMNGRYIHVFLFYSSILFFSYVLFLTLFRLRIRPTLNTKIPKDRESPHRQGPIFVRLEILSILIILFCVIRIAVLGEIPILGNLGARYQGDSLGGFVDYTCTLANPISWILLFYGMNKSNPRKKLHFTLFFVIFICQIAYFRRQDVFEIVIGSILVLQFSQRILRVRAIVLMISIFLGAYILLGVAGMLRAGAANVSSTVDTLTLPFWMIVGDMTGAVKLGHYIVDIVGPGGLLGNYSFGIFFAALGSETLHGAAYVQRTFTSASTAQSINAPLSYYADFGTVGVVLVSITLGAVWATARRVLELHPDSILIKCSIVFIYLKSLWTIRSGGILFDPFFIYAILMLFYLSGKEGIASVSALSRLLISLLFLSMFTITVFAVVFRIA